MKDSTASQNCGTRRLLWLALAIPCALQAFEIGFRGIDPDEFEHLHAAYLVFRGEVPYRDFFEHHAPALYYLLQPLFWLVGGELSVLWLGRLVLWLCSLGTLALTARVANRLGGAPAGLVAATLLAWSTIFHLKGIELRPDVPATLLVTSCVALALDAPLTWRRWLTIAALAGLATLFTQKSIVPIAGLTVASVLRGCRTGHSSRAAIIPAAMLAGGAFAWGGALSAFAIAGADGDFLHGTVEQLLSWPVRSQRWEQLRPTLVAEPAVWIAGLMEILAALRQIRREAAWRDGRLLAAITAILSAGSLVWVKATYSQFYLLWFPLLAALAACRIVSWSRASARRSSMLPAALLGGLLLAVQSALGWRAFELQANGSLPHLSETLRSTAIPPALFLAFPLLAIGMTLVWYSRRGCWPAAIGIVASLGMFHAVLRDVDAVLWSNREQVRRMAILEARVGPNEMVLDGYSGYGALRPHAYYFWWINEYSQALMPPKEQGEKLLARLQAAPPAAVLFDNDLQRLPKSVTDWISSHYQRAENEPWLWVPTREMDR
jgi:Dolichyl-phosphate-mannose-protein mannosyltransferase